MTWLGELEKEVLFNNLCCFNQVVKGFFFLVFLADDEGHTLFDIFCLASCIYCKFGSKHRVSEFSFYSTWSQMP